MTDSSTKPDVESLLAEEPFVRSLARLLLAEEADEVVQQTYLRALASQPSSVRNPRAWLGRIVRNVVRNFRRTELRRESRDRAWASSELVPSSTELMEHEESRRMLVRAVDRLPDNLRTVLLLRFFENLPPREIARRLELPVAKIWDRLHRALTILRERLDAKNGDRRTWLLGLVPLATARPAIPWASAATSMTSRIRIFLTSALAMPSNTKMFVTCIAVLSLAATGYFWLGSEALDDTMDSAGEAASVDQSPRREAALSRETEALPDSTADSSQPDQPESSEPQGAGDEPYGALDVQVRWHDGTPAPGVLISFRAEGETRIDRSETRIVADAEGIAHASRLHAGAVRLTSDRGGRATAEVLAGLEAKAEFKLPRGIDVDGLVVDNLEGPIGGADILLASGQEGWLGSAVVATSQPNGRFEIRAANPQWSLGAIADGYSPSVLVDLDQVERPAGAALVELRLRLSPGGVTVSGRVVDEDAEGIAGALVLVGRGGKGSIEPGGRSREVWDGVSTTTDEDGSFACKGLRPGHLPLTVRADGYAIHEEELAGAEREAKVVAVTLVRGVTVQGTVRDARGEVVAGAMVRADARKLGSLQLAIQPEESDSVFPWPATRSDADGHFELSCIPPGEIHLLAGVWKRRAMQPLRNFDQKTLQGSSGDVLTWDPVLEAPRTILIRVVDANGKTFEPPVHVSVIAEQSAPGAPGGSTLPQFDPPGTYIFPNAAFVPYTVYTRFSRDGILTPWVYKSGVWPGDADVVLQLTPIPPVPETGTITGRIVDTGQRIADRPVDVKLLSRRERRGLEVSGDRFEGKEIPPGRYYVRVKAGGDQILVSPWFELKPAQKLDLGDLKTEPGGDLRVSVRTPGDVDPGKVTGRLGGNNDSRRLRWDGEQLAADNITAGLHRFRLQSANWFAPAVDIEIIAGRKNTFSIDVLPATRRQIMVLFPLPDQWQNATLTIRDARGASVYDCGSVASSIGFTPRFWVPTLPVAQYTLEALIDGQRRTWPLDFGDPSAGQEPMRISMR